MVGLPERLLAVGDALSRLREVEPRASAVAELRLCAELGLADTAAALDTPVRTVERDWACARIWLYDALR